MTPKEKAEELLSEYYFQVTTLEKQKQCALITVDEMIKQYKKITVSHYITCYKTYQDFNNNFENIQHQLDHNVLSNFIYWQEVKQEINAL